MADERHALSPEELERQEAVDLPDREAMTLISTMPHLPTTLPTTADDPALLGPPEQTTGAPSPTDATGMATDAAASESGEPSTTDQPRNEQIVSNDSAVST